MHPVSVVIVNWNRRPLLARCLSSLRAQEYSDHEVIVVDNGSTDGSASWVAHHFPEVRLLCNPRNLGFGAAVNQGVRATHGSYVATLNNDAVAQPGWLQSLMEAAAANRQAGMFASEMVFAQSPSMVESTGICVDRVGIAWDRQGGEIRGTPNGATTEVFGACAGAALYSRAMLDEIGLFDEDFFAYLEDVDLCWRAQWAGWRCLYVPGATVHHAHSATGKEGSHLKNRLLGRNKIWMLCKNYPSSEYVPLVIAYDLMSVTFRIATGGATGAIQGRIQALGGIPLMLRRRRRLVRKISSRAMMDRLEPIESPWASLRRFTHLRAMKTG